jgi:hypothetical protein
VSESRREIPEKATHLVRAYDGPLLLYEVWVQGWGTVQTEIEAYKLISYCNRVEVQWLGGLLGVPGPGEPARPRGHIETVWTR